MTKLLSKIKCTIINMVSILKIIYINAYICTKKEIRKICIKMLTVTFKKQEK